MAQEMDPMLAAKYLQSSTPILCEKCGHNSFTEHLMLRKLSKIITATQKDSIIPVPVFACGKCGHINSNMIPDALRIPEPADNTGQVTTNIPVMVVNKD